MNININGLAMEEALGICEEVIPNSDLHKRMRNAAAMVWCAQGDTEAINEGEKMFEEAFWTAMTIPIFEKEVDRMDKMLEVRETLLQNMI